MVGIALTWSACKKSSNFKTLDSKTVSSQVALTFSQAVMYTALGGFNPSDGLDAQYTVDFVSHNIACGSGMDTTINQQRLSVGGLLATITGNLGFSFICTDGTPSGFTMADGLTTILSSGDIYKMKEKLTAMALNPASGNPTLSVSGTVEVNSNLTANGKTTIGVYNYTLNSVVFDPSKGILSGSVSFTTTGTSASGKWDYSGSIVFESGAIAKVTINSVSYIVDLRTGAVRN